MRIILEQQKLEALQKVQNRLIWLVIPNTTDNLTAKIEVGYNANCRNKAYHTSKLTLILILE